jgi:hypothetical protein
LRLHNNFFCQSRNYFFRVSLSSTSLSSSFLSGRQQTMTDILDDQVDELLRKAEQRLKDGSASAIVATTTSTAVVPAAAGDAVTDVKQQKSSNSSSKKDGLTVRAPPQPLSGLKVKEKVRHIIPRFFVTCALHEEN